MKRLIYILIVACALAIPLNAQTPFDSFAPEATRPMLELEESTNTTSDSILCAIVADVQNQMFLLVDVSNGQIVLSAPITDDIRKWLSVDPLADNYPGVSPYAYCHWNPINRIDPDGRADYYDVDGNWVGTDNLNDNKVYQQNANGEQQFGLGVLQNPFFTYLGDVTSVKLEFNGEMTQGNHKATGVLSLKQVGDNFEFVRANYDAISGSRSLDCLPNGDYNSDKFRNRTADAMVRDGVGFSINLNPVFDTNRSLLRIHPDGGKPGTEGCIGLIGNQEILNSFVELMQPLYGVYGNIPLNVNINKNPNYHHF